MGQSERQSWGWLVKEKRKGKEREEKEEEMRSWAAHALKRKRGSSWKGETDGSHGSFFGG